MRVKILVDFDRGPQIYTSWVWGNVYKSYGVPFVKDFESSDDLRPAERECAEDRMIEHAKFHGMIEEVEPDAMPRMGRNCY